MEKIILNSYDSNSVAVKLSNNKKSYVVEEILGVQSKVYSDIEYFIEVDSSERIINIDVYINGELSITDFRDGCIFFCAEDKSPFRGIIGFVQISLCITYGENITEWLYSDYISVLIKPTDTNVALDKMLKYIYTNQSDILNREINVTGMGKHFDRKYDDFWSQIVMLEEIANIYENNFGYFKANSRYKLEQVEALDRVEKLQNIDSKTVQYIVSHPEYLQNSVTGIKYGGQFFLPTKTIMLQKRITYDTYENQVVISFLEHVNEDVTALADRILEYIRLLSISADVENGYIVSSYLMYVNAKEILSEFFERIEKLKIQFRKLVNSYSRTLNVRRISMIKMPEPTNVFMNLPQYNMVYLCILRWFSKKGYDLINERVMLNFINAPAIYEAYVLIKIISHIKASGYELVESKIVDYPKRQNWKYKNQRYNNTYIFNNENAKITLYYEPVIYDEDRSGINGIGLYRNNSVSLNKETDEEKQGHYYVPDYVLKYEESGVENYIILDAKFSKKNKVKYQLMPELLYKYITSISATKEHINLKGLYIMYGLSENNMVTESFFDKQIKTGKRICPLAEMVPLAEEISYSTQGKSLAEIMKLIQSRI